LKGGDVVAQEADAAIARAAEDTTNLAGFVAVVYAQVFDRS
jgi:hypothetical protein